MTGIADSPVAALLAFSAATNLGLAGRVVRTDRDAALLSGFGARVDDEGADLVLDADGLRLADGATRGPSAAERIDFARAHMPASRAAAAGLPVRGVRVGLSLVLEPKTAVLALLLQEAGAEVDVFAFAMETDDAVAAELRRRGVAVHASATATPAEERAHALALLDARPRVLVDDGAHVLRLAHRERPDVVAGMAGASEETTSGVRPLEAMHAEHALDVPVIAANDAVTKSWFDNRHGTGETCVLAIIRVLGDDLAGRDAVVAGFGPVGEGVAQRLAALGARVTVADLDPRRALAARFAGHRVAPLDQAVRTADLVVSATGAPRTVDAAVLAACAPDAAVAVAGGAPEEVLPPPATRAERLGPHLERLHLPGGGAVRLLAGGDCVNIVAGEGNPIDVMDLSFAVQLTAIRRLLGPALPLGVHRLTQDEDRAAAGGGPAPAPSTVDWRRTRFDLPAGEALQQDS
ncbi:adenosylhomocysteinase [Amnibacterium endophyticum]|uniref:Adenosylhomocysteinase n=1 Tax=Amnibacterium endophyticum TaxID=2109337 RepID=A0ABW4LIC5_9MICO